MKLNKKNKQLLLLGALAAGAVYLVTRKPKPPTATITLPMPTGNYLPA